MFEVSSTARRLVVVGLTIGAGASAGWVVRGYRTSTSDPLPPRLRTMAAGPDTLVADGRPPREPVTLLWYEGHVTQATLDGRRSLTDAGRVLVIDDRLTLRQPAIAPGRNVVSAVETSSGWLAVTAEGSLLRSVAGRLVFEAEAPFDVTALAPDPGGGAWAVRSDGAISLRRSSGLEPLFIRLDSAGAEVDSVRGSAAPVGSLLGELANAGWVVARGETLYFAPLLRDELLAIGRGGDTLWRATRGLRRDGAEPRFVERDGAPAIDYRPVTEGLALGPDGNLYLLGSDAGGHRLDVFRLDDGYHLRLARLTGVLPTVAINPLGRLYLVDPFLVLGGPPVAEREAAPPFDLERLGGGRLTAADLRGRVTLANFWASWCAPCRDEMPALDTLRRSIENAAFAFVAINEDVDVADAERFLEGFGFDFPVALGRGEMRHVFHNRGIPFTVLFDREGRIARQWLGYGGPEHMAIVRTVVEAELRRGR